MKKLALVGAAGLAALSMSCSDITDDPGGSWTSPFTAVFSASAERVVVGGTVTANEGNTISSVTIKANDKAVTVVEPAPVTGGATLTLNSELSGLCEGASGPITITVSIAVAFSDGDPLEGSVSGISVPCAGGTPSTGDGWTFTLSNADKSYADLDAKATYTSSTAPIASIDIIAFHPGVGCANGYICSPWAITTAGTGEAYILPLEAGKSLLDGGKYDEFKTTYVTSGEVDEWADEDSITITAGDWFLVDSTDGGMFAVKVVSFNSAGNSVELKSVQLF
jgi:hypothetical protein